jgi:hypothetical protein
MQRALIRAGSSAILAARAEAVRQVRERREIKASAIRNVISIRYPLASEEEPKWVMTISSRAMPIGAYPHRQVSAGVSAEIKAGSRTVIRGAFVAAMKSGHRGVFMRSGRFGRRGNPKLERIRELYTTRVVDVFRDPGFVEAVGVRATEVFQQTLDRNLAFTRGG